METFDYKKQLKEFYSPSKATPAIVDVPAFPFILVDGTGDPNTSTRFRQAVQALFPVSYELKFTIKKQREIDYKVMPLTGYWSLVDPSKGAMDRDNWAWTLGIQQPDFVTADAFAKAVEAVRPKKSGDSEAAAMLDQLRFEKVTDGLCGQILHIGPFDAEQASFAVLDEFVDKSGFAYAAHGHKEIYLSDFRKTAPEKLKTILRKKVRPKAP